MILAIFLSLFLDFSDQCTPLRTVRREYHKIENKQDLEKFITMTENNEKCRSTKPYYASAIMQKAKYATWPATKYKHFKEGKKLLEDFIEKNKDHIEGRYVRVMVQSNTPGFLNYDENIQEDIAFILENIPNNNIDKSYRHIMINNIRAILKDKQK